MTAPARAEHLIAFPDAVDRVLDKGVVIDGWARLSLGHLELTTLESKVVVASIETYLRYADALQHATAAYLGR